MLNVIGSAIGLLALIGIIVYCVLVMPSDKEKFKSCYGQEHNHKGCQHCYYNEDCPYGPNSEHR